MKAVFRRTFERDLKKIKNRAILTKVRQSIEEVEAAVSLKEINGVKKLGSSGNFYRRRSPPLRQTVLVNEKEKVD